MKPLVLAISVLNLGLVGFSLTRIVREKEDHLANGRVIRLELAPVDPRSLLQGDYMRLAYKWDREQRQQLEKEERNGFLVFKLDERGVGAFVRTQPEVDPVEPGHVSIRYRRRRWNTRIGAEAFFFQEGTGDAYRNARFAEIRVSPKGQTLITRLLDERLVPIEAPPPAKKRAGGLGPPAT